MLLRLWSTFPNLVVVSVRTAVLKTDDTRTTICAVLYHSGNLAVLLVSVRSVTQSQSTPKSKFPTRFFVHFISSFGGGMNILRGQDTATNNIG